MSQHDPEILLLRNTTPSSENYWSRRPRKSMSAWEAIRRSHFITRFLATILPMRFGNEYKLCQWLGRVKPQLTLDMACGVGKVQIPRFSEMAFGADIEGYPTEIALSKGYRGALVYNPPEYFFSLPNGYKADAITIINLNAHISKEAFGNILIRALENSINGNVQLFMINEYEGANLAYCLMKSIGNQKFNRLVAAQQHDHFSTQESWIEWLLENFPQVKLIDSRPVATMPPMLHWWAYFRNRVRKNYFETGVGPILNLLFLFIEIPLGLLDSFFMWLFPESGVKKSYLCAHQFVVDNRK